MKIIIEVPDNPTNENVLQAIFPDYSVFRVCMLDKNEQVILHDMSYHWLQSSYTQNVVKIKE